MIETRPVLIIVDYGNKATLEVFHMWDKMIVARRVVDGPIDVVSGGASDKDGWGRWGGKAFPVVRDSVIAPQG